MKIEILGTRGNVEASKPYHSKHTGFLIDDKILVDVGEKEFIQHKPEAIVFTHFHPDHAWFVKENKAFEPNVPLYGPEENKLIEDLQVKTSVFEVLGYRFIPIPCEHSLKVKTQGYFIEKENTSLFISSDVAWIEKKHYSKIKGVKMVITEASFGKKGGLIQKRDEQIYGHTGVPDLVRLFSPLTEKIIFTHYGTWFLKDVPKGRQKIKDLQTDEAELIAGYDGMILEI